MTGNVLFKRRLRKEWKFQWSNLTSIVDRTVLLYGILFTAFMGALLYDALPSIFETLNDLPTNLLLFLLYQLCWFGTVRIFMEYADEYFLMQRKDVLKSVKLLSISYALLTYLIQTLFIIFLLYFVLINIDTISFSALSLLFFFSLLRFCILTSRKLVSIYWNGWKRPFIVSVIYIGFMFVAYIIVSNNAYIIGSVFAFLITIINLIMIIYSNSFFTDAVENEKQRLRYVQMIFHASEYVHIPASSNRTKPLLFRKSERIFSTRTKENALKELYIKYFLRNYRYPLSLIQMISVTMVAIVFLPLWMKYALLIAFFFFIKEWLSTVYDEIVTHPYLQMYESNVREVSRKKIIRLFYIPATMLVGVIVFIATLLSI